MGSRTKGNWLRILLVVVLLLAANVACVSEEQVQQWLDRLAQDATQAIEQWAREQVDSLVEDIKQEIADWWEDLQRDAAERWRDFWASIFPPAPTITAPADSTVSSGGTVNVRGTGLPDSTLTLSRDGKHYGEAPVNAAGEWQIGGVILNKGDNTFSAKVKKRLFSSAASPPVRVTYPGGEMGAVPAMSPAVDSTLDPPAWMVEVALELLKADGDTFYEERRAAFTAALRAGLQASEEDYEAHRFINPDVYLSFDMHVLVFPAPKDATTDQILEACSKAVESAFLDEAVRQEMMLQITKSLERMNLFWTVDDRGETFAFEYVRIELDRTYLLEHFDPRTLAKFRTRLGTELVAGLLGEALGRLGEMVIKMGFAMWGRADAGLQAQHYYDLAIRAWNHRNLDGTPLRWDDPANNAFDGDMGYRFATNEEWAMFYLGRSAFYVQSPADPYYTIPYYKPEADLYAFLARKAVSKFVEQLIAKKAEAVLGKVLGGARPITAFFTAREILDWTINYLRYEDAREVRDQHRPNFAEFVDGSKFQYPMPEELKSLGAATDLVGYPYRGPSDFMLHEYLAANPLTVWERGENPPPQFDVEHLLENRVGGEFADWATGDVRKLVRNIGTWAAGYVHPGSVIQSDKRVPEGDMIYGSPYYIREMFTCQRMDNPTAPWWEAPQGSRLRLTWLDGTVVDGVVDYQPGEPQTVRYVRGTDYVAYVPVHVVGLSNASYIAGNLDSFPFSNISLVSVVGDERHLYAAFDAQAALPPDADSTVVPSLMTVEVGLVGNRTGPADLDERDGSVRIAADRLAVGILATQHLLGRFAAEAPAYRPPDPVVVGPDDLGVALGSPAKLHLYDRRGRHVGPNATGGVDLDIPGARYFTNPETGQQFIVVPNADLGEHYAVRVEGTESGTFDLDVFYGDRRRDQAVRLAYKDVPLSATTVAELAVQPDDLHTLRVDDDKDGAFDRELPPSQVIQVAVVELGRAPGIPGPVVIGIVLLILSGVGAWVLIRWPRRRQPPSPPAPPGIRTCPHCGTPAARPTSRFCGRCGARLP
jgi:hypothetical protein